MPLSQEICFEMYTQENPHMNWIQKLIDEDLSEPYSVFTYRYFVNNWPKLTTFAIANGSCIGVIVCKYDEDSKSGYIGMLAVKKNMRRLGIAAQLVKHAIALCKELEADSVTLEAECSNIGALRLYLKLGFVKEALLGRYYMNGSDAYRLRLWLK